MNGPNVFPGSQNAPPAASARPKNCFPRNRMTISLEATKGAPAYPCNVMMFET